MSWYREFKAWRRATREARENRLNEYVQHQISAATGDPDDRRYRADNIISTVRSHDARGIR